MHDYLLVCRNAAHCEPATREAYSKIHSNGINHDTFRVHFAYCRHPWCIREVCLRCPLGNAIHLGENIEETRASPTDLKGQYAYSVTLVSLPVLGSGGWWRAFFGKYQISSPSASPVLHSQIQSDRVLPTGPAKGKKPELLGKITLLKRHRLPLKAMTHHFHHSYSFKKL